MLLAAGLTAAAAEPPTANNTSPRFLVLVIDFEYLTCTLCLDPVYKFLDFIRAQNLPHISGIITLDAGRIDSFDQKKAVIRQVQGFIRGNRIRFPIYLDSLGILASRFHQGAVLLCYDDAGTSVKRYRIPLPPEGRQHIMPPAPSPRNKD